MIKYIATVFLIAIGILFLFSVAINNGLRTQPNEEFGRINQVLGHEKFDILFLGSSRTTNFINPLIVDKITNLNSYNLGFRKSSIIISLMFLRLYLENHPPPRLVVLNIDFSMFNLEEGIFELPMYFPYLDNKIIYNTLSKYDSKIDIVRFIPFLSIAYYDDFKKFLGLKSFLGYPGTGETKYKPIKGFYYLDGLWNKEMEIRYRKKFNAKFNNEAIALLQEFIDECKLKNVNLLFVYAPQYSEMKNIVLNFEEIMNLINDIAVKYNIKYIRYDNMSLCQSKSYFVDMTHLNKKGAQIYSVKLANDIRQFLKGEDSKSVITIDY